MPIVNEIPINRADLARLYKNLGGEERLTQILEAFYQRMAGDVLIGFFFAGKDLTLIALKQKQFLMRAMGAAPSYLGKPPAQAHTELAPILPGHFDRRTQILKETLRSHQVSEADIETWIGFEATFRSTIEKRD